MMSKGMLVDSETLIQMDSITDGERFHNFLIAELATSQIPITFSHLLSKYNQHTTVSNTQPTENTAKITVELSTKSTTSPKIESPPTVKTTTTQTKV